MRQYLRHFGCIAFLSFTQAGCQSTRPLIANDAVVGKEAIAAIANVRVGMQAEEMLAHLIPAATTSPVFKTIGDGSVRYFFGFGPDYQVWVDVVNKRDALPLGPGLPNGVVSALGSLEPRVKWRYKWEDSNELQ